MKKQSRSPSNKKKSSISANTSRILPYVNEEFMKKSFISPQFQNSHLEYSNYDQSPAPPAPPVFDIHNILTDNTPAKISNEVESENEPYELSQSHHPNKFDTPGPFSVSPNSDSYEEYNSDEEYSSDSDLDGDIGKEKGIGIGYNDTFSYAKSTKNKDLRIFKMKVILAEKKKQMFEKEIEVKKLREDNSFLESVISDYEYYNNSILEEKNKQKMAIKILSDHIRDISRDVSNDEYKISRVKTDQSMLLKELQQIQDELKDVLKSKWSKIENDSESYSDNKYSPSYNSSDDDYNDYNEYNEHNEHNSYDNDNGKVKGNALRYKEYSKY